MDKFKFQAKWKEELIVTGEGGNFILELLMGELTVYLPTEKTWRNKSPDWVKDNYIELKEELEQWCFENNAQLIINESANIYYGE